MYVQCKRNVCVKEWIEDMCVKANASFSTELKLAYDIEAKGLVGSVALVHIRIGDEGQEQHISKPAFIIFTSI